MKKDYKYYPFDDIQTFFLSLKDNTAAVTSFLDEFSDLTTSWSWLGPQVLQHLHNTYSKHSSLKDLLDDIATSDFELGLFRFLVKVPRSLVMKKQTAPECLPYSGLVPIYLTALGRPYSRFSNDPMLQYVVHKELYEAMTFFKPDSVIPERNELLAIREAGMKTMLRGKQVTRSPETYHRINGLAKTPLAGTPIYAVAMLTQIWAAHPNNRHKNMVLDPINWDNTPEDLISSEWWTE